MIRLMGPLFVSRDEPTFAQLCALTLGIPVCLATLDLEMLLVMFCLDS